MAWRSFCTLYGVEFGCKRAIQGESSTVEMASRAEVLPVLDLGGDLEFLWGCGLVFLRYRPSVAVKLVYRRGLHGYKTFKIT